MGNSEPSRAPKLQDITDMADVKDRLSSPFKISKTYIQDIDCLRVLRKDLFHCLAFKLTFLEIGQGIPWRSTVCFEIMNRLWSAAFTADGCVESLPTEKRALWDNFFCQMRFFFFKGAPNHRESIPPLPKNAMPKWKGDFLKGASLFSCGKASYSIVPQPKAYETFSNMVGLFCTQRDVRIGENVRPASQSCQLYAYQWNSDRNHRSMHDLIVLSESTFCMTYIKRAIIFHH